MIGGINNLEKKSQLQIELFDTKKEKLIARSKAFHMSELIKTISHRNSLRKTSVANFEIEFNNLVANTMSKSAVFLTNSIVSNMYDKEYSKTFSLTLVGFKKVESMSVFKVLSNRKMKIIPFFGLDYSQANLTFDDDICLHRTKEDKPKVYLKIMEIFNDFMDPLLPGY